MSEILAFLVVFFGTTFYTRLILQVQPHSGTKYLL